MQEHCRAACCDGHYRLSHISEALAQGIYHNTNNHFNFWTLNRLFSFVQLLKSLKSSEKAYLCVNDKGPQHNVSRVDSMDARHHLFSWNTHKRKFRVAQAFDVALTKGRRFRPDLSYTVSSDISEPVIPHTIEYVIPDMDFQEQKPPLNDRDPHQESSTHFL